MSCGWTVFAIALLLSARPAAAQESPRPSQHGTVSQKVHTTTISIAYDRPVARGRDLFGALVSFDTVWSPAANRAAIFETDREITIEGQALPAGKYSVWTVPGRERWAVVLSRDWDVHHTRYPGESEDALRVTVAPIEASHMEALAFYFAAVDGYSATLRLHWGATAVPVEIEVGR